MIEPLLAQFERRYIAIAVEHGKRLTLFEHPSTIISQGRNCQDIELVLDANDIIHGDLRRRISSSGS
jgi:hypothetical protein